MLRSALLALFGACSALGWVALADGATPRTSGLHEVRGVKLYVETFGSGRPIVFLHGGVHCFDSSFGRQVDYFAALGTVVGIDQRGHGHSPDNARPFSYQEMADDTAALIQQLGLGPTDVVGHSDGGNVGLLLARDHPELVRRLVVSGANLRSGKPPDEVERLRAEPPEDAAKRLPARYEDSFAAVSPDGREHWPTHASKARILWATPVVIDAEGLKKIEAPVLVVAGDHDFISIEETTEIFRGLPHGQLLILPATGHDTFKERASVLNPMIRAFLESPEPTATER